MPQFINSCRTASLTAYLFQNLEIQIMYIHPHRDISSLTSPSTSSCFTTALLTLQAREANINKSNQSVARNRETHPTLSLRIVRTDLAFSLSSGLDNIFYSLSSTAIKKEICAKALLGDEKNH